MPVRDSRYLRRWPAAALVWAALASSALTACTSPGPQTLTQTAPPVVDATVDPALAAMVPPEVARDGVLDVGTDPPYRPMQFYTADRLLTGVEVQLVMAAAATLGLRAVFTTEAFTALESGVRAGRFELGAAALTVAPMQIGPTDAVLFLGTGTVLVRPTGAAIVLDDMCGRTVSALEGSTVLATLAQRSIDCRTAGKRPISIQAAFTQGEADRLLLTGRVDAMASDAPVAQAVVQSYPAEVELAPGYSDPAALGMLAAAGSGLAQALAAALNTLIDDGRYDTILRGFGITRGHLERAAVVPAGTPAALGPDGLNPADR